MSNVNVSAILGAGLLHLPMNDELTAGPASNQSQAVSVPGQLNRCTSAVANGSFILDSVQQGVANGIVFFVNDSGQTIKIYCASGESMNGSTNGSLSVPTGETGVLIPVPSYDRQGNLNTGAPDWRAAAIS